ncbi:ABC transporter permease [Thermoanaerobacterium thermosaccharolyticum]|uniref:ABC transporter permease n=1 Tax=Thermoanaerobacterium thermosaccharolyticum TaxID=1517 RepID=UPI003D28FC29
MIKLIKYEFLGRYKYYLGFLAALILLNIYLITKNNTWSHGLPFVVSFMAGFACFVAVLISGVMLYQRDMYGNTGYLLFTLPQRGFDIAFSKLIISIIEFTLFITVSGVMAFINLLYVNEAKVFIDAVLQHKIFILYIFISALLSFVALLILSYFSITISKIAIYSKKYSKALSIVIFLLIFYIIGKINGLLVNLFPYNLNISPFSGIAQRSGAVALSFAVFPINVASFVFQTLVYIGLFTLTSYLIDKKIDL